MANLGLAATALAQLPDRHAGRAPRLRLARVHCPGGLPDVARPRYAHGKSRRQALRWRAHLRLRARLPDRGGFTGPSLPRPGAAPAVRGAVVGPAEPVPGIELASAADLEA